MVLNLSERAADIFYWAGGILILLSAIGGLVGTLAALWGDRERERYADARETQANVRISENEKQTKQAVLDAATANKSAADTNLRAANAEKEAAVVKLELEKLKERDRPRTITQDQIQRLTQLLSKTPRGKIRILSVANAPDAREFSIILGNILTGFGFDVSGPIESLLPEFPYGLRLVLNPVDNKLPWACGVQLAFKDIGFTPLAYYDKRIVAGTIELQVSRKE